MSITKIFRFCQSVSNWQVTECVLMRRRQSATAVVARAVSGSGVTWVPHGPSQDGGTCDKEEVSKFAVMARSWWDEGGQAVALHTLNRLRVPFIRDGVQQGGRDSVVGLQGVRILDVGCGGGVLAEPLARLGATVHGIDALQETIETARWHADLDADISPRLSYSCHLVEDIAEQQAESYDAVVCSEIIEHVADASQFLSSCCTLIKPGGSIFITTINKTRLAYALAVVAAENIFQIVESGTHDWNKFMSPQDLNLILKANGLSVQVLHGMCLNPVTMKWSWTSDTSINYALHAVKNLPSTLH